jgi:S-adenosyl-L-methionine hydrolase (adenosine-forming)
LVDLTHGVAPFDIRAGALALERAVPYLGPGVVIGVVDPGVAGDRRAVAVEVASEQGPRFLVGPDNGLLMWAADALGGVTRAVALTASGAGSPGSSGAGSPGSSGAGSPGSSGAGSPGSSGAAKSTFDGRDVFAPAAAALWLGTALDGLGAPLDPASLVRLAPPVLSAGPGLLETEVLWVDTFGNVQLSATPQHAGTAHLAECIGDELDVIARGARVTVGRVGAFSEVPPGRLGLLVDANGHLALAGDRSSAASTLGLAAGDPVKLVARGWTDSTSGPSSGPSGGPGTVDADLSGGGS